MLIVQIEGNVKHPITLDPTVWIFDDRKVLLDDAFKNEDSNLNGASADKDTPFNRDQYQQQINPPINESIKRFDKKKVLENSYLMPLSYFLPNSEPNEDAAKAILHTDDDSVEINFTQLENSYLLFALKGKTINRRWPGSFVLR
ncbi:hypothetical protein [Piscibacillus salipiscarius]|uniref:hypothetical protein n=1 Tax=Piscibacillus salipiscarius TaxID=299480 RepID=UPI000B193CCA|nr:hypothetical protein [Piscibacillus salipiscarius]